MRGRGERREEGKENGGKRGECKERREGKGRERSMTLGGRKGGEGGKKGRGRKG